MPRELDAAPKIEFPCERYLIKVVGDAHPDYQQFVAGVLVKYDPAVTVERFSENPSKNGRFVSLTIWMRIEQEAHLTLLFDELKVNPMVKMVL
jgi:putative lipoic acid-binding regulatory protein